MNLLCLLNFRLTAKEKKIQQQLQKKEAASWNNAQRALKQTFSFKELQDFDEVRKHNGPTAMRSSESVPAINTSISWANLNRSSSAHKGMF